MIQVAAAVVPTRGRVARLAIPAAPGAMVAGAGVARVRVSTAMTEVWVGLAEGAAAGAPRAGVAMAVLGPGVVLMAGRAGPRITQMVGAVGAGRDWGGRCS